MVIKFKVNPNQTQNKWIGWFGENIIKVRIIGNKESMFDNLINFINTDLGIKRDYMHILEKNVQTRLISIEFPPVAWELFLGVIDK